MMDSINSTSSAKLFSATIQNSTNLESLSNSALSNGIDLYIQKDYKGAIKEFQRSIGLALNSSYSTEATEYMANAYLKLDDAENAIKTYQRTISLNTTNDDLHIKLGNLFYAQERYQEAQSEYEKAVQLNPTAESHYSLGQAYLETGRYMDAHTQFGKAHRLAPESPNGKYGIGLAYSKQERYEDAIRMFKDAIGKKKDFYDAYAEMGYAYADLGQMDEAQKIVDFLDSEDSGLADILSGYMYKVDPPKFSFVDPTSTFLRTMPRNTLLSTLDDYLANANASKTFTMIFQFDKEMDRESVENRLNWTIKRSTGSGPGEAYNFGFTVPDTEVTISLFPDNVYYDAKSFSATVRFTIEQNENADGTIDPSHIEFSFTGKDKYGLTMDSDFDQVTGFSGIA
ncbi:MAG: tetratricopeptide repeat protein [Thermodesulfobacteriota bacterium]|nr:tetratricopeptide repeat protein [Thermodesulfobacteriota bacterium]